MLDKFIGGAIIALIVSITPFLYRLGKQKKQESIQNGKVYYGLIGCRILGFFVLGVITAEMILMILLGNSIEGLPALLITFVAGTIVTVIYVFLYKKAFEKKYLNSTDHDSDY